MDQQVLLDRGLDELAIERAVDDNRPTRSVQLDQHAGGAHLVDVLLGVAVGLLVELLGFGRELLDLLAQPPDPRRRRAPRHDPRSHCREALPITRGEAHSPARAPAQLRDVAAASPGRQHRHRALARACGHWLTPAIHPRRSDHQGTRACAPDPPIAAPGRYRPMDEVPSTSTASADYADQRAPRRRQKPANGTHQPTAELSAA
jgi:hypothetical protein